MKKTSEEQILRNLVSKLVGPLVDKMKIETSAETTFYRLCWSLPSISKDEDILMIAKEVLDA